MRPPSRHVSSHVRRALAPLAAVLLVLGVASTARAADDPTASGVSAASAGTTSSTGSEPEPTPVTEPVPASPDAGEPVTDPGPTPTGNKTAADPVRVLLEGDSITQGFNGDYTWRYRLAKELARQGAAVDLVGSKHATWVSAGYTTSSSADPAFDPDHFATVGSLIDQHARWIAAEATAQRPDVVVLAAGVNDLRWGHTPQQAAASLRRWVANLRAVLPNVQIVLSPVLAASDSTRPWLPSRIAAFDSLERQVAQSLTIQESPITVADTTRGWSVTTDTWDGLHPTPTGEALIAQRVAESLHTVGVLPKAPAIAEQQPWVRKLPVSVRLTRGHATLTWDRQMLTSVRVLMTPPGQKERMLPGTYTALSATVPTLDGGRYAFRLVAVRRSMVSTPGPSSSAVQPWSMASPPSPVTRPRMSATAVAWTASPRARTYVVATRTVRGPWVVRTTSATALGSARAVAARVWAVNPAGRSARVDVHR